MFATDLPGRRRSVAAQHVLVAAGVLLLAACADAGTPTSAAVRAAEGEPTTTFSPSPQPAPLFDLLQFTGDFPVFSTPVEQVTGVRPDGLVLGTIVSVSLGEQQDLSGGGALQSAYLGVRASRVAGDVRPADDGLIYLDVVKPAMVSHEALDQAYGYDDETLFLVRAVEEPGTSLVEGRPPLDTYRITHPMSLYAPDEGGHVSVPLIRDYPVPAGLEGLTPDEALDLFAGLLE
jgi:hypothetical protein